MRFMRITLVVAAIMTGVGAYIFAVPESALAQQYSLPGAVPCLYTAFIGYILLVFSATYAWMATQPTIVRPLLYLGAFGKGGVFVIALLLFAQGTIAGSTASLLVGDGVLALLWFGWLFRTRAAGAEPG